MLEAIGHLFAWIFRPFTQRNKGNLRLAFGCLVVSGLIWIFNSFNKNHTAKLRVPLEIRYPENTHVPLSPLPKHVVATVKGYGWHIFRAASFEKHHKVLVWLRHPGLHSKLDTALLRQYLEDHLSSDLKVIHVYVDSLAVPMDLKASKWLHMKVDAKQISLAKGFKLDSEVTFDPDSVLASGPHSIMRPFPDTVILHIPFKNIDKDFNEKVNLDYVFHNPNLTLSEDRINVEFKVQKQ
jgi:hypothetical protein